MIASNALCYLIIVQPSGIPLYANSFDFDTDKACQSFEGRFALDIDSTKKQLLGGMLSAIKDMVGEILDDPLQFLNINFNTFRILALNHENILFLGIFEQDVNSSDNHFDESLLSIMTTIANRFQQKYNKNLIQQIPVRSSTFENFTHDIIELGIPIVVDRCRNCLSKCKDENKECIPHLLYFEEQKRG